VAVDAPIVKTAIDATRAFGWTPTFGAGSSDANYPVSLGIPSIDIGGGGRGTEAHALGEAFDTTNSWQGTQRALLLTIALVQK
jgi:tripeptide aminopeptidase